MKALIFLCLFSLMEPALAGLEKYSEVLKADSAPGTSALPRSGVRITYLGTNAYLFESRDAVLLVDPYFSRQSLFRVSANLRPVSQIELIARWVRQHPKIDAVLVTHGHIDHLFDAPEIVRATGAKLIASSTCVQLAQSAGLSPNQTHAVRPGAAARAGGAFIRALPAQHDRVFGIVPFNGPLKHLPPQKINHWVAGEPLAFLIEIGGKRIFINSGGRPEDVTLANLGRVDLAIIGVALPDSVRAFPQTIRYLQPRYILPSHQDNFFRPLRSGFVFGPLTNFPAVRRAARASRGELILLDYFRPWTLR